MVVRTATVVGVVVVACLNWAQVVFVPLTPVQPPAVVVQPQSPAWLSRLPETLPPVRGPFGTVALAVVLAIFLLLQREDLRNRFIRLVGRGRVAVTTKAVDEAGRRISRYLLMQLIVNG